MASDKKTPIIKKIIKKGHGGHHGGSWKVAYADFVTAMMAFFLVMWLLAISSEQGKAALADYFQNLTMSDAVFNGGMPSAFDPSAPQPSILDGGCFQLTQQGAEIEQKEKELDEKLKALEAAGIAIPPQLRKDEDLSELPEGVKGGEGSDQSGVAPGEGLYKDGFGTPGGALTDEEIIAKDNLAAELSTAGNEALDGDTEGQFSVEKVPGGIRLELMDKEKRPIFISGQPRLTPVAQQLLGKISEKLSTIPNKISLEGHTDAVATLSQELTNWELSTARASAARRFLSRHGIPEDRVTMVAGFAATRPLPDTDPTDPVNRRISIMIWDSDANIEASRQGMPVPPTKQQAPQQGPSATPPSAGDSPAPTTPQPPKATREAPVPTQPTPEQLERQLLEDTLRRAATPDTSTAGPPVSE